MEDCTQVLEKEIEMVKKRMYLLSEDEKEMSWYDIPRDYSKEMWYDIYKPCMTCFALLLLKIMVVWQLNQEL